MVCHEIRLRGDDSFSYRRKKKKRKKQDIFCSCMWVWNFRVKRYIIGIHNAMAQIGLETNS